MKDSKADPDLKFAERHPNRAFWVRRCTPEERLGCREKDEPGKYLCAAVFRYGPFFVPLPFWASTPDVADLGEAHSEHIHRAVAAARKAGDNVHFTLREGGRAL
ncbi:hypothetical protein [Mangrovicoccus ximenensis]|uniref:hypothetical protein n=1 Tax=Mangrovicoccus ximenensis TaxID=1911570 RepID=UPI0011AE47C5|nr:hypothetical protein [Mangrovicoccus ximenensis]